MTFCSPSCRSPAVLYLFLCPLLTMSAHFCLALLALCSLTTASDPECAELLKPLEERSQVSGKWIFHIGTSDNEEFLKDLKDFNSSRIEVSPIPDSDNMTLRWMDRIHTHEQAGKHLQTCTGCILWSGETKQGRHLFLFTAAKSGKLDDADLDVFKKQAACLNFPAEFHFSETIDLCPEEEEEEEEEEAATDVKEGEH
ncbi:unnamed protein product [Pleuronectes platessa]|uniref:Apolipoprotein M n=1 Tax=Pleuronectes platessa TaxID=8262 RepID=A0A9N7YUT5_PLEPL|nr:unnamed protein product [Pleuronectes platessa]